MLSGAIQPATARVFPAPVRRLDSLGLQVGGEGGEGQVAAARLGVRAQQRTDKGQAAHTRTRWLNWRSEHARIL